MLPVTASGHSNEVFDRDGAVRSLYQPLFNALDGPSVEPVLDTLAATLLGRLGNIEGSHSDRWADYLFPTAAAARAFIEAVLTRHIGHAALE